MRAKSGFTLVEILIVVVILGILAAIVIPQFTSASTEAKQANLVSNLQAVRSQIELYKIHHNDELPGQQAGGDTTFTQGMTGLTDVYGVAQAAPGAGVYGPYMRNIPKNPFTNVRTVSESALALTAGTAGAGWHFVISGADAGLFQAADDGSNPLDGDTLHVLY